MCHQSTKSQTGTHSVDLIKCLPLLIWDSQVFSGLDAAAQLAGPDLQVLQLLLFHKSIQGSRKLQQTVKAFSNLIYHLGSGPPSSLCLYLMSPWRKTRVATQSALQIVCALSVPTQVDGPWLHVDVHQVVDNFTLYVILDTIDEKTPTHIYHLDVGEIPGRKTNKIKLGMSDYAEGLHWLWDKHWCSFTCHSDRGPEVGSWFCNIQFSFESPSWRRSCCSPGSPGRTPSLPTWGGKLSDGKQGWCQRDEHLVSKKHHKEGLWGHVCDLPWCLTRWRWDLHTQTQWRRSEQKKRWCLNELLWNYCCIMVPL